MKLILKYTLLLSTPLLMLLTSCRFNPNMQGEGSPSLQGEWVEAHQNYQDSLIQYTSSRFTFTCDSFYVELNTKAKANYFDDHCFNSGQWKEYAKGNYVLSNDTLYLVGTFTKANYKQKLDGCYRIGQYLPTYLVKSSSPEKIELINLQEGNSVIIDLKKRLTCTPKPL